jgi:hypothetical protein
MGVACCGPPKEEFELCPEKQEAVLRLVHALRTKRNIREFKETIERNEKALICMLSYYSLL